MPCHKDAMAGLDISSDLFCALVFAIPAGAGTITSTNTRVSRNSDNALLNSWSHAHGCSSTALGVSAEATASAVYGHIAASVFVSSSLSATGTAHAFAQY